MSALGDRSTSGESLACAKEFHVLRGFLMFFICVTDIGLFPTVRHNISPNINGREGLRGLFVLLTCSLSGQEWLALVCGLASRGVMNIFTLKMCLTQDMQLLK